MKRVKEDAINIFYVNVDRGLAYILIKSVNDFNEKQKIPVSQYFQIQ